MRHFPTGHVYKKYTGVVRPPKKRQYNKPPEDRVDTVSASQAAALRAWWWGCMQRRKVLEGGVLRGIDYLGDSPDWPEMATSAALAQSANRTLTEYVHPNAMATWLLSRGAAREPRYVPLTSRRGRVTRKKSVTFYCIAPLLQEYLDTIPPDML